MRKDAVVLEIRKKTAVVLASDGRFLRVRNHGYQVGQRIAESEQTPVRLRPVLRRTLLIAACLVLALGSSAMAASKYLVWSYAGVDVGDISVNYTLNFRNEVLSAEGNSEEAEQLLESLERIPYEPIDSAVERMVDAAGEKQQEESEEAEIVISVASFIGGTGRTEDRIMEGVDRSMEKARPDEPKEKRQEDVRIEHIEWQDAGQFMDDRHHPQGTQNPADMNEERKQPEEVKPETTDNPPVNQSTDMPESTQAAPAKTDEKPVQNPVTNPAKPENPEQRQETSGQDQQAPQSNPSDTEKPGNKPTESETIPGRENHTSEDPNSSQPPPASQDSPEKQPTDSPPAVNDMQGQYGSGTTQEPQRSGEQNQTQPTQPQSRQPQQVPGSDNAGLNPGEQNRPDNVWNPSDKR